ncbi:Phosphoribulokinase/uridine kinase [Cordyceps fumosorosea ARSEF 2679]|uniref:Phosphoribulokinase/uridine kinase n=1 Tax=Cordyceps fumosorosea (strain ARSEF 2679) TaxID=1081104 RepID=A0A167U898_CORFA|nr:Phosphoribulokinase/uridine kinase [Cordyceps fumosorosea ARSEF 2679]OAA61328.1 Phosphoribulokinase/uridine kinase [Cordyceps fumosorosea ARSEF 2679]
MPPPFVDDKAPICVPFILEHLAAHRARHHQPPDPDHASTAAVPSPPPLVVGLNGIQGAGKTTLVAALTAALAAERVRAVVCSIDDFYLPRHEQAALAARHPDNALVQHRGEPGTHDVALAVRVFTELIRGRPAAIPQYDKAAFHGRGDRRPESAWLPVEQPPRVDVLILEGWSVGFRALPDEEVGRRRDAPGSRTLRQHALEHLLLVNGNLRAYDALTDLLDVFVHIDAEDTQFVYAWRAEQEDHLRQTLGDPNAGMTKDQVIEFVDGYYPAYELYTDGIRSGIFANRPGCQLRMVLGRDRCVKHVVQT